jgi:tether containing UBX domain for GLUT4
LDIIQILEFACQKHDFQVEKHELKHHNKTLDVSIQFRFSGIPNNAQLEMVESKSIRQETEVFIGLQLESGERVTGTFAPNQTLSEIIEVLVKETLLNPVIIYMRKEVYGDALSTTSIKMLGLTSGRAMSVDK